MVVLLKDLRDGQIKRLGNANELKVLFNDDEKINGYLISYDYDDFEDLVDSSKFMFVGCE